MTRQDPRRHRRRPRRARAAVTIPPVPWAQDMGADGPAQPRRVRASVDDPARDPRTGARVGGKSQVMRRAGARVLRSLPEPRREAARLYAETFEGVEAGGAATPAGDAPAHGAGGGPQIGAPCRQFRALRQVERLRRLEAAIGPGAISLRRAGGRPPAVVSHLGLVRALIVREESIPALLGRLDASAGRRRETIIRDVLSDALGRVARSEGLEGRGSAEAPKMVAPPGGG
ncbi:hypothetical protein [Oceanicella actignis]|uniref:Uncharacterized protein n=1 Tax=Oceanicella actignis TaxID=1189325 RepID=A0A1M7U227_9RHOB|nr:hypothetical protein [Oceanicella actignis]SES76342.1 hypothetical protein SAMN04488119_101390 [Oceanicella actignis]SHN76998.1 hypothetical protein SAMN05216200_11432 [Oceanicella actignis]